MAIRSRDHRYAFRRARAGNGCTRARDIDHADNADGSLGPSGRTKHDHLSGRVFAASAKLGPCRCRTAVQRQRDGVRFDFRKCRRWHLGNRNTNQYRFAGRDQSALFGLHSRREPQRHSRFAGKLLNGIVAAFWLFSGTVAFAQTTPPSKQEQCTPAESGMDSEQLGKKLSDSKGVICPPATHDSEIKVQPPDSGAKTPVIKPPDTAK
ncbi:MAG TPA: hypothetical protein VNR41_05540 [Xanthobacteraceae bacterium]|nr:hypothetical protein [Xanthobacteraceae bacterium]